MPLPKHRDDGRRFDARPQSTSGLLLELVKRRSTQMGLVGGLVIFLLLLRFGPAPSSESADAFPVGRIPTAQALASCGPNLKRQYGLMIECVAKPRAHR